MLSTNTDTVWSTLPTVSFYGADGEGDPPTDPPTGDGAGKTPEPDATTDPPADPPADPKDDGDTFDRPYVEKLRKEAADTRKRAQAAEAKLKERDDADLSDMEKLTARIETAETTMSSQSTSLREERVVNAVLRAAHELNFHDPTDARGALILDDIDFNEAGYPDLKQVTDQLKAVAKAKPYLISTTPTGSGDGAPTGEPVTPADKFQADVDAYSKELKAQGFVEIPQ